MMVLKILLMILLLLPILFFAAYFTNKLLEEAIEFKKSESRDQKIQGVHIDDRAKYVRRR